MGKKRKHSSSREEERINKKIRDLEKKRRKIISHDNRHYTYSESSSSDHYDYEPYYYGNRERAIGDVPIEDLQPEESQIDDIPIAEEETMTNTDNIAESNQSEALQQPNRDNISVLDSTILSILGDEPITQEIFDSHVHKDISSRWSHILTDGLKDETLLTIMKSHKTPENLKLSQAPTLNPEIKAASNENVIKRDNIIAEKQKILGTAISILAKTITSLLSQSEEGLESGKYNDLLKNLSDSGRLICYIHHNDTQTRRNFAVASLSKEIKDSVKEHKRDNLLFGKDLQENIRSMKAITKTGAELRSVVQKPKYQQQNKINQGASTSKALNWRGAPAPAPPPRRRPQTRPTTVPSTIASYGRNRPAPPPARRTINHRAQQRPRGQPSRR